VALLSPSGTPAGAKAEVKKLLQARNIRASIADNIITRIFNANSVVNTPASELPPSLDENAAIAGARSGAATPANDEVPIVYVSATALEWC
jgi:CLIP-associating protein 1/2